MTLREWWDSKIRQVSYSSDCGFRYRGRALIADYRWKKHRQGCEVCE